MSRAWQNESTFEKHDHVSTFATTLCARFAGPLLRTLRHQLGDDINRLLTADSVELHQMWVLELPERGTEKQTSSHSQIDRKDAKDWPPHFPQELQQFHEFHELQSSMGLANFWLNWIAHCFVHPWRPRETEKRGWTVAEWEGKGAGEGEALPPFASVSTPIARSALKPRKIRRNWKRPFGVAPALTKGSSSQSMWVEARGELLRP